jgi:hypothetical protein
MEALYNRNGQVYAWLDSSDGRIFDLRGRNLAFVDGDSVWDWKGKHIAWWRGDHIRDRNGAIALFTGDAENLGVFKPFLAFKPFEPFQQFAPFKPFLEFKPFARFDQWTWSSKPPF